ncbi:hypothetical protein ACFWWM_39920 [Streptomyces sp. NPDC058682]|uniref:hypothetical protein n=1 Tax=Streptomyces sp. NPDC058682 TaxID=3346596 RepID=UPI0036472509
MQHTGEHDAGVPVPLAELPQVPAQDVVAGVTAVAPADGVARVGPVPTEVLALVRLPVASPPSGTRATNAAALACAVSASP